jgi:hypothetical protein
MKTKLYVAAFCIGSFCALSNNNLWAATPAKNIKFPLVQAFIDSVVAQDPQIEELCIYATPAGSENIIRIASNDLGIIGQPADPEDLEAMHKNKMITLKDPDDSTNTDITYPINVNGKPVAVGGVMFRMIKGKTLVENVAIANAKAKKMFAGFETKIQNAAKPMW